MHQYGVRDVEKLLRLSRSTIRALIASGFVSPARGPRNTWLFSFQDLIVLRTAQSLSNAKVPTKRITASLKELRRQLPETMPLSGLSISAVGEHVVVRDGAGQRKVDSGQYLLAFEGDPSAGSLSVIDRKPPADESQQWFDRGIDLEVDDPKAAIEAYEKAIAADPDRIDARINLGLMLHETGNLAGAEQVYREAARLSADDGDPVLHYNLAILLEDMERVPEAVREYEAALGLEPAFADCHYNLALLYEKLRQPREAIRHMAQYRRLTAQ